MTIKNLLAAALILPFLLSASGAAYANQSLDQLRAAGFNSDRAYDGAGLSGGRTSHFAKSAGLRADMKDTSTASGGKGESVLKAVKDTLSENKTYITAGLVGALLGFMLLGPAGIMGGAMLFIGVKMYTNLI